LETPGGLLIVDNRFQTGFGWVAARAKAARRVNRWACRYCGLASGLVAKLCRERGQRFFVMNSHCKLANLKRIEGSNPFLSAPEYC
jgi:hypothetical protein